MIIAGLGFVKYKLIELHWSAYISSTLENKFHDNDFLEKIFSNPPTRVLPNGKRVL